MKKLIVLILSLVLCLSVFTACGNTDYDDSALLERIAQLEKKLEDAKQADGIKGDKGDTGEQGPTGPIGPAGPQGPKGDGIDFAAEPLALGTEVKVRDSAGLVLFTINCEETATHWVVTITNVNMYVRFKVNDFVEIERYSTSNYSFPSFPDVVTPVGATASVSQTKSAYTPTYISIYNTITGIPYAVYII